MTMTPNNAAATTLSIKDKLKRAMISMEKVKRKNCSKVDDNPAKKSQKEEEE